MEIETIVKNSFVIVVLEDTDVGRLNVENFDISEKLKAVDTIFVYPLTNHHVHFTERPKNRLVKTYMF